MRLKPRHQLRGYAVTQRRHKSVLDQSDAGGVVRSEQTEVFVTFATMADLEKSI